MNKITINLLMLGSTLTLNAQQSVQDSLEMGAEYVNEVYYKLEES